MTKAAASHIQGYPSNKTVSIRNVDVLRYDPAPSRSEHDRAAGIARNINAFDSGR
jgi:hypothetical protein